MNQQITNQLSQFYSFRTTQVLCPCLAQRPSGYGQFSVKFSANVWQSGDQRTLEEDVVIIISGQTPALPYDYYGFPDEAYQIQYPAPGDPVLAEKMYHWLHQSGIETRLDSNRGFDHVLCTAKNHAPGCHHSLRSAIAPE